MPRRLVRAAGGALALAAAAAACDATAALRGPRVRDVALRWAGDTVLVAGSTAPASVEATVDGDPYPFPRVGVASSDTSVVAVAADGSTIAARRVGAAVLTVRLLSAALPGNAVAIERPVRVVPKALLLVGGGDTLRSVGDTATLRATALDALDRPLADLAAAWASSDTTVAAVGATGVVTARRDGEAVVRATVAGLAVETRVRVRQRVARLALGPAVALDALGADAALAAAPVDARGAPVARLGGAVAWESSAPGVATVAAGRVTAVDNGTAWLRAAAEGVRDSVRVEVAQRAARVVVETPGPLALRSVGETAVLRARGYDRRDNEVRIALPTWRSLNQPVAHVEPRTGIVTAIAAGEATLLAELDGASASLAAAVADVPDRVVADPQAAALESVGDTLRIRWSVRNARGVEIVGAPVAFGSSDTTVAVALADGRVVGVRTGASRVVVTSGAAADTVIVTVANAVAQVDIVPQVVTLASVGDTVAPAVVVRTARGQDLSPASAAWRSGNAGVASVVAGVVTARAAGQAFVHAESPTSPDRRDSVLVVVTDAPASLRLTAERDTLTAVGQTRVYGVDLRNARGGAILGFAVAWASTDPTVVTVSPSGVVTAIGLGAAGVVARAGVAADTVQVTVRNALASLEVTPGAASVTSVGDTVRLRAVGRNGVGAVVAGVAAAWRSLDTLVASALADGRVVAVGTGTARVVAAAEGLADTATVLVANAVAVVDLQDGPVALASVGDSALPAVALANARGAALPRGAALWTSDDPLVARVTGGGIVIATGAGETTVRASGAGAARDSVAVVVTNAPASVTIDGAADTLTALGRTRARAAEVRNARGALLPVVAAWRTADPGVATVSASGVVTASGVGTTRVIASAGAAADTLLVTVRDVPVVLELPAALAIRSIGDTALVAAVARNELGAVVAGVALSWRSTDSTIARPLGGGLVTAVGVGTARLIASAGALVDTAFVTVTNDPAFVDLAKAADTLTALGDSVAPAVTVRNARDDLLPRTAVAWSSDDPLVARVSPSGVVTARDTGSTWVRAAGGGARDSIRVVVLNVPTRVRVLTAAGADAVADTMTAVGQAVAYSGEARNRAGAVVAGAPLAWRSTDAGVAAVSGAGVVTAAGVGQALVVVRAGEVEDSVRVVVVDPSRLYVDNAVPAAPRFGTPARPFATIQDAVNAAGAGDTVIVRRGTGYSESVTLKRRVTILGDSAAFVSGGRDPLLLPLLRHDLGPAGVTTEAGTTGASYTIRYLAVQHTVDGEAIALRDPSTVAIEYVYVNPVADVRAGRGILVERPGGLATIARSRVDSVTAFGVRLVDADGARVTDVSVRGVGSRTGFAGAGVELAGGTGAVVQGLVARRTAGPQVLLSGTTDATLSGSTLAGEQALARLAGVLGATTVTGNTFDLRAQAGDPAAPGAGAVGLDVVLSAGVSVSQNVFLAPGGQPSSTGDGVRLTDVRAAAGGAAFGAELTRNQFGGGRSAVKSERSTWSMSGSRSDTAYAAVLLGAADTVTLSSDTLMNARSVGVSSSAANASVRLSGGLVAGPQRAVVVSGAARAEVRGTSVLGAPGGPAASPTLGAVDLQATDSVVVAGAVVAGHPSFAGVVLRGGPARMDSSVVTRNLVGVRLGFGLSALSMRQNSLYDNDALPDATQRVPAGVLNDGALRGLGANWWGDARGPRKAGRLAATLGDSVGALVTYDSLAAPPAAHQGAGAIATLRKLAGDNASAARRQSMLAGVRALDAQGRPLAGVAVAFSASAGRFTSGSCAALPSCTSMTVTTDAQGVADVQYETSNVRDVPATITADAPGKRVTFTVVNTS